MRHGEVFNPEKVLYGRLPGYKLSALGLQMAERAAQYFKNNNLSLIVSSPLERAQQTAAPTANLHNLKPQLEELIIEAENVFEGKRVSVGDGALRDPRNWWHLRNPLKPSWGEPYKKVAQRMRSAIFAAKDLAKGQEALLVSHQLPIWIARLSAEGKSFIHDPRKRQCSLASVTTFVFENDSLVAVEYEEPAADLLKDASKISGA
ncbi:fructose-2,6-bisphosphatase [freshwater metagenome]|uniref:Fructose-2,6-bisphosphatase n=1 Tax=freshwater metagenome TaxID=449393 RepID=A0A094PR05_9ZZZZ